MKTIKSISLIIIILFSYIAVNPASAEKINALDAKIWYVDDDGTADFTSIQDAIDNASDGDTVFVYNGEYNESIEINKNITLQGEDNENTILKSYYSYPEYTNHYLIYITSDNVVLKNFNTNIANDHSFNIFIKANNTLLKNNVFNNLGIILSSSYNNIISNNFFNRSNVGLYGPEDEYPTNNKISNNHFLKGGAYIHAISNEISYNLFDNSVILINGDNCYNNIIKYNIIKNNQIGMFAESGKNKILNNDFISNDINVIISYSGRNTWRHNYWERSRLLPKIIFGYATYFSDIYFDIDWFPAKKPNCDFGVGI